MNIKLALGAMIAALMLTACAKQEAASTDTAAPAEVPAEAAPEAMDSGEGAGSAEAPVDGADATAADGAAPAETPPAE